MDRYASFPAKCLYAVEVSGWDSTQDFFVERCDLEWNESSGKQVALNQRLHESAILFIRHVHAGESGRSHPMVYEAEMVGKTQSGLRQFRLNARIPRLTEQAISVGEAERLGQM
jgi:hypothetical protein